jgi:uncharacterized protein
MVKRAPSRFNPDLLARDASRYEAEIPLSQFTRLSEQLLSTDGQLATTFGVNQRKDHCVIRGSLSFEAVQQCQRCMEAFTTPITAEFELVCVATQAEADALPDELDPVVLDDKGQLHLVDLLEDDALLQLPDIPKHVDDPSCQPGEHSFGDVQVNPSNGKPNPFGALKDLKLS